MFRNPIVVVALFFLLAFFPVAFVIPRLMLFDAINAFGITFGATVMWAYWPGVKDAATTKHGATKGHYLILGIFITWVAMIGRTICLAAWRILGEPEGWLDNLSLAFFAALILTSGVFHLMSPRVIDGVVPKQAWNGLLWATGIGILLTVALVWLRTVLNT